jgi:hypothetical protein
MTKEHYSLVSFLSIPTLSTIMSGLFVFILILILSIFYLDALCLVPSSSSSSRSSSTRPSRSFCWHSPQHTQPSNKLKQKRLRYQSNILLRSPLHGTTVSSSTEHNDSDRTARNDTVPTNSPSSSSSSSSSSSVLLTHSDIIWKVRPPPETSMWKRGWLRFAANLIRLECIILKKEPPLVLCPKGGQAVLEAYYNDNNNNDDSSSSSSNDKWTKVGRFGITTQRGPPAQAFQDTIQDLYDIPSTSMAGVAAIVYMYVEPQYRKRDMGTLALQVISLIHAIQGCDFTVLVADDNGSRKLVDWYERHGGYKQAPKLQDILGSPNAVNGITMIAPTNQVLPTNCTIQWW